jgi:hypothetical protein
VPVLELAVKHPVIVGVIAANLLALLALCFIYPEFMVGPGPLIKGHAELANDCLACHTPWRGAASPRYVQCHALHDIGLRTSHIAPLPQKGVKTAFNRELVEQDCMACHSDHAGPRLTQRSRKLLSHDLLRAAVQPECESCHAKPADSLRRDLGAACGSCHTVQRWKLATFKHSLLDAAVLARCEACRKTPAYTLHQQFKGDCGSCHGQEKWKRPPSTMASGSCWTATTTPSAPPATPATATRASPATAATSTRRPTSAPSM